MSLSFTAYRRTSTYWEMTRPHFHSEAEILFPLTDGGTIFIDTTPYPLGKGCLFVMDAAVLHRSFSHRQTEYDRCVLRLPTVTLQQFGVDQLFTGRGCCIRLTEEEFTLCTRIFDRLLQPETALPDSLLHTAALAYLMALVVQKWDSPLPAPTPTASDSAVEAVIAHIRTHLTEPLTLDGLADTFFLSKSALCHRFKAATGFSVIEYIIHCRIQHARTLLSRGCPVQQAGDASGFGDSAHFIRTFRRITGMTPGQYARSVR